MLIFAKSHREQIFPIIQVYRQLDAKLMTENFMVCSKFNPSNMTVELIRLVCGSPITYPETFGFQHFYKKDDGQVAVSNFLLKKENISSQDQAYVNGYMFEFVKIKVSVIKEYSGSTEFKKDAFAARSFLNRSDFDLLDSQVIKQVLKNKFIPCDKELSESVEPFIEFLLKQSSQNTQKKSA